jgi:hypothetical protein
MRKTTDFSGEFSMKYQMGWWLITKLNHGNERIYPGKLFGWFYNVLDLDPIKQFLNFTYKVASLVKIPLRKNLETS